MKPRLYIETTIPSYLTARASNNIVTAARQQVTKAWWASEREKFDIFISQFVFEEVEDGDGGAASERLDAIADLPLLTVTTTAIALASQFLSKGIIPKKAERDAAHIAVASVNKMDYLMTWNCKHIANATILRSVERICREQGFQCPVICTPDELMGG